ncbi:uncharacterized protein EV422DRAFT_564330 [Fimicolochytrium jonesii]|uniref:uncharacterized protein n=1 Tax=Fimicolochytrium jonesii TaxID=1396493 RepID=UPI0022FEEF17|nr:uncharacterized protein EV422DRAFT_564330 [Fimicolochytrium jonesii]KAI8824973.1 hypothetical protein EV422DRAFT_564330 [Fimicolochytrium jonesii]
MAHLLTHLDPAQIHELFLDSQKVNTLSPLLATSSTAEHDSDDSPFHSDEEDDHATNGHSSNGKPRQNSLAQYVNLEHLSLNNCNLHSVEGFPVLKRLAKLDLGDNKISGGLETLAALTRLESLDLSNNKIADLETLAPLKQLPNLKLLNLVECEIAKRPDYPDIVFQTLPQLQALDDRDKDGNEVELYSEDDYDEEEEEGEGEVQGGENGGETHDEEGEEEDYEEEVSGEVEGDEHGSEHGVDGGEDNGLEVYEIGSESDDEDADQSGYQGTVVEQEGDEEDDIFDDEADERHPLADEDQDEGDIVYEVQDVSQHDHGIELIDDDDGDDDGEEEEEDEGQEVIDVDEQTEDGHGYAGGFGDGEDGEEDEELEDEDLDEPNTGLQGGKGLPSSSVQPYISHGDTEDLAAEAEEEEEELEYIADHGFGDHDFMGGGELAADPFMMDDSLMGAPSGDFETFVTGEVGDEALFNATMKRKADEIDALGDEGLNEFVNNDDDDDEVPDSKKQKT